eukprot:5669996-Alexandrium_andersonii.AAC.1
MSGGRGGGSGVGAGGAVVHVRLATARHACAPAARATFLEGFPSRPPGPSKRQPLMSGPEPT